MSFECISLSARISAKAAGDGEVRDLLKRHLVASLIDLDTVVLDELGLCQGNVFIDVAAVSGELHGFEIKSPADTLARWPKQLRYYSKVVDRAWLVATDKALAAAQAPGWWGLIRIVQTPDRLGLRVIRPAQRNPKPHAYSIARLLWRDEAIQALDQLGLARGVRSKRRAEAWHRLADQAPLDHLRASVRAALKVRPQRIAELANKAR
jgi:hypothetical protein